MWSMGEGNGKPLQHSYLENPLNSTKRQKDRTLKDVHTRENDRKQHKRNKLTTAKIQEGAHQWMYQGGKHKKWW